MKPLIEQITDKMIVEYEDNIVRAVQSVGIDVDKERLAKALIDSRSFYDEGYADAKKEYEKTPMKPIILEWGGYLCPHCKRELVDEYFVGIKDYKFCYHCGGKLKRSDSNE